MKSKLEQVLLDIASVRALLDDLYNDVGSADAADIRAGIDACSTMLKEIEDGRDDE